MSDLLQAIHIILQAHYYAFVLLIRDREMDKEDYVADYIYGPFFYPIEKLVIIIRFIF